MPADEPPSDCPQCYGRPRGLCPNCGQIGPEDIEPPFIEDRLAALMARRDALIARGVPEQFTHIESLLSDDDWDWLTGRGRWAQ